MSRCEHWECANFDKVQFKILLGDICCFQIKNILSAAIKKRETIQNTFSCMEDVTEWNISIDTYLSLSLSIYIYIYIYTRKMRHSLMLTFGKIIANMN